MWLDNGTWQSVGGGPWERRFKYSSVTFDWHVLLGWNGLISVWLVRCGWGGKLHLSLIPRPHLGSLTHLSLDWQSLSDGASNRGKGGFHFRNAQNTQTKCLGYALKLQALEDAVCSQMISPREYEKVFPSSHPGNGCWQSFHWFISQFPPTPSPSPLLLHLLFLHPQCDWWSIFLLLNLAPNLVKVTGLTWANPKWGPGTAVDKLKQCSGIVVTNQMKRSVVFLWVAQELNFAALNAALFKIYHLCDSVLDGNEKLIKTCAQFLHYPVSYVCEKPKLVSLYSSWTIQRWITNWVKRAIFFLEAQKPHT